MAHSENYSMKDYSLIWSDVKDLIRKPDFAFVNVEAPVLDSKEWSSFPYFNMHSSYVQAAIDAGFNVFSLVNNHSNDQGKEGILSTRKVFSKLKESHEQSDRKLYFSGIKNTESEKTKSGENNEFDYVVFNKNGFSILFIAVTEILNQNTYKSCLNFVEPGKNGIKELSDYIKKIREIENPDFVILSFHSSEEEYVIQVGEKRKKQYREYLDAGADIVWANHPHVVREREIFEKKDTGKIKKIIFYGNGNTISGQRRNPQYRNPREMRDYTGDGLLFEIKLVRSNSNQDEIVMENPKAYYITTLIDKNRNFILKKLNQNFIESLENEGENVKASYFRERKNITENTKETIIWF